MRSYCLYSGICVILLCYIFFTMGYFSEVPKSVWVVLPSFYVGSSTSSIHINPCHCKRQMPPANLIHPLSNTTCSEHAHARGTGQKVVAFSFYEKDETMMLARKQAGDAKENVNEFFFKGLQTNIDLLPQYYPGWVIRIYHDIEESDPLTARFCEMTCKYDFVDLCNVRLIPAELFKDSMKIFPMLWRFFPTLDPEVELFVSRDLDSRFSAREEAAVSEWVESGRALHAMRDHPWHPVPMLGGGWGARLTDEAVRGHWRSSWTQILNDHKAFSGKSAKGQDQDILRDHVWTPWGSKNCVQHDSYCCRTFPGSIGFPTQRKNEPYNFFGSVGPKPLWEECPIECRREGHKDWKHC